MLSFHISDKIKEWKSKRIREKIRKKMKEKFNKFNVIIGKHDIYLIDIIEVSDKIEKSRNDVGITAVTLNRLRSGTDRVTIRTLNKLARAVNFINEHVNKDTTNYTAIDFIDI